MGRVNYHLVDLRPWSATWWSTMGYRAHAKGQYDLAIEAYSKSLELRPDEPWVVASLIRAHRAAGKTEAAGHLLTKLRSISPSEAAKLDAELKDGR